MKAHEIRSAFLNYFQSHQHRVFPSHSLTPEQDPSLLFVNAGMVPFKSVFLGNNPDRLTRATSAQQCIRAGGKHNDLEQVGYTARHHTFFEMLGNFSFGDYFKEEAITLAWQFLTDTLKIDPNKLWVTVYHTDEDTESIWLNTLGIDPTRFSRCGDKDNFWSMGDTGPCGPCTEIFYDHGPDVAGGPPGSPEEDGDRYVEIWNLVFMQYNRLADGTLTPLPEPCVDTGMGLERIAAVMQGVHNNYEIDLFAHLLNALTQLVPCDETTHHAMRVMADHIRATAFLISDGITPSNEGRGYVLRRIIRRAARHAYQLGQTTPFFHALVPALIEVMGSAYPALTEQADYIAQVIEHEEIQFIRTLSKGMKILTQAIDMIDKDAGGGVPGQVVFQLYDTYGFPPDLTADVAREQGLSIDHAGFEALMHTQQSQSQTAQAFTSSTANTEAITVSTEFLGYHALEATGTVIGLLQASEPVERLQAGETGVIILDRTPFYAESGGQVGDSGLLFANGMRFMVSDTQRQGEAVLHHGELTQGSLAMGEILTAQVDTQRKDIAANHTATHLLHAALRAQLGPQLVQKGSLVDADRLRFDFAYPQALTAQTLNALTTTINEQIRANTPVAQSTTTLAEAKSSGAMALFDEKYAHDVHVIDIGPFSKEICGGTHVQRTGDIGLFVIQSESAIGSGIRRIEALTGTAAIKKIAADHGTLSSMTERLKTDVTQAVEKLEQLQAAHKAQLKQYKKIEHTLIKQSVDFAISKQQTVAAATLLIIQTTGLSTDAMRHAIDLVKSRDLPGCIAVVANTEATRVQLIVYVDHANLPHIKAPEVLKVITAHMGGRGGGRPALAQGSGESPEKLSSALASIAPWLASTSTSE
jgi:alanyl-tRNA synthetase